MNRRTLLKYITCISFPVLTKEGTLAAGTDASRKGARELSDLVSAFTGVPKALWVWRTPLETLSSAATFMRRWGFNTALYSIPASDRTREPAEIRDAFDRFRQQGLALAVVAGDPSWVAPSRSDAGRLPAPLTDLFRLTPHVGPLQGLVLDIEPHTLAQWRTGDRRSLAEGFITLLRSSKAECARQGLSLWAALHPSIAKTPAPEGYTGSLASAVLQYIDVAVTMGYRNTTASAITFTDPLREQIAAKGVPWYFGLTTQGGADATLISYFGFPIPRFLRSLLDLDKTLRNAQQSRAYRGLALHQYSTTADLLAQQAN